MRAPSKRRFALGAEKAGIAHEWSGADTGDEPTMRAASTLCNSADLVVASQYHDSIPAAAGYSPDELVLGTGRPVLIVPTAGALRPVGNRALVAWNGSREVARAIVRQPAAAAARRIVAARRRRQSAGGRHP